MIYNRFNLLAMHEDENDLANIEDSWFDKFSFVDIGKPIKMLH